MNWKKGFQRIVLIVSVFLLVVGALITWDTAAPRYREYRESMAKAEAAGPFGEFADIDPETGQRLSPEYWKTMAEFWRDAFWKDIRLGTMATLVVAGIPWALFGLGLFVARGFSGRDTG